jgi:carboxymethylenebutenolidase
MLKPNYALAAQVPANDPAIRAEHVSINSPQGNGKIDGYLVKPANAAARMPVVIVIHENRGRTPYIEDVTRRLAKAGFIAMSPDGLTSLGGYPGNDERGAQMFGQVDGAKMREDLYQAAEWLRTQPFSNGKLGAIGFCFGGGVTNQLAVRMGANLAAGVPFYGGQPGAADVAKIKAPISAQNGEADPRITNGSAAYAAALTAAGVPNENHIYKNAQHGFHNDTTPRYDKAAAEEAWMHTLNWFNKYLKA